LTAGKLSSQRSDGCKKFRKLYSDFKCCKCTKYTKALGLC